MQHSRTSIHCRLLLLLLAFVAVLWHRAALAEEPSTVFELYSNHDETAPSHQQQQTLHLDEHQAAMQVNVDVASWTSTNASSSTNECVTPPVKDFEYVKQSMGGYQSLDRDGTKALTVPAGRQFGT